MSGSGDIFNKQIRLAIKESITEIQEEARQTHAFHAPVSYTHLTLPTTERV